MNYRNPFVFIAAVALLGGSCKKNTVAVAPLASLNITNAVVGGKNVKLNSDIADSAVNYNYKAFGLNAAAGIYVYPTGDSTHPYYTDSKTVTVNGGIYSLFLSGSITTQVDAILVKETIPAYSDSSCGVRFINLVYNGNPVIVTQTATPTVTDFSSLSYKQISSFKTYPALSTNGTYSFQVRDATTNAVLATYSLATPRFFNCTLVWKGMTGGTGGNVPGILRVNNY
jgi:hypothetical protein